MSPSASRIGGLAQQAVVEALAARPSPSRAASTVPLTAGPSSSPVMRNAIEPLAARHAPEIAQRRRTEAATPPFMSHGAAPVQHAVDDLRRRRVDGSSAASSPGGTTSVWPAKTRHGGRRRCGHRGSRCPACRARRTSSRCDLETGLRQHLAEQCQRAAVRRRHRGAADEGLGEGDGIQRVQDGLASRAGQAGQSRSSSLMLVLERVCASTRFTITAQYSDGPGSPSGQGLPGMLPDTTTE